MADRRDNDEVIMTSGGGILSPEIHSEYHSPGFSYSARSSDIFERYAEFSA